MARLTFLIVLLLFGIAVSQPPGKTKKPKSVMTKAPKSTSAPTNTLAMGPGVPGVIITKNPEMTRAPKNTKAPQMTKAPRQAKSAADPGVINAPKNTKAPKEAKARSGKSSWKTKAPIADGPVDGPGGGTKAPMAPKTEPVVGTKAPMNTKAPKAAAVGPVDGLGIGTKAPMMAPKTGPGVGTKAPLNTKAPKAKIL